MADIMMCKDEECPKKDTCYRYTAKVNPDRQAYFLTSPKRKKMGGWDCDYYWKVSKDGTRV